MLKRYTVTLREDTVQKIQVYADKRGISFSAAVRCIVSDAEDLGLIQTEKPQSEDSQGEGAPGRVSVPGGTA